jgi:hypothetical protein
MGEHTDGDKEFLSGGSRGARIGGGLFGFFFGLPFAFGGVMVLLEGLGVLPGAYGVDLFSICFSLPFRGVGGAMMVGGLVTLVGGITGKDLGVRINRFNITIGGSDDDEDEYTDGHERSMGFSYPTRDEILRRIHEPESSVEDTDSADETPLAEEDDTSEETFAPQQAKDHGEGVPQAAKGAEDVTAQPSETMEGGTGFWDLGDGADSR